MSAKPTPRQLAWLEKYGIDPLSTRNACSSIISYVIEGNGLGKAETSNHRLNLLKAMQARYEGKEARYLCSDGSLKEGIYTILRLYPKNVGQIRRRVTSASFFEKEGIKPFTNPFNVTYINPRGKKNNTSLGNFVLCEEVNQNSSSDD